MTVANGSLGVLLPHAGAMVLPDGVLAVGDEGVRAAAPVRRDGVFAGPGEPGVPDWVGIAHQRRHRGLVGSP